MVYIPGPFAATPNDFMRVCFLAMMFLLLCTILPPPRRK